MLHFLLMVFFPLRSLIDCPITYNNGTLIAGGAVSRASNPSGILLRWDMVQRAPNSIIYPRSRVISIRAVQIKMTRSDETAEVVGDEKHVQRKHTDGSSRFYKSSIRFKDFGIAVLTGDGDIQVSRVK